MKFIFLLIMAQAFAEESAQDKRLSRKDETAIGCVDIVESKNGSTPTETDPNKIKTCGILKSVSQKFGHASIAEVGDFKQSSGGKIICHEKATYTIDYVYCVKALEAYDKVMIGTVGLETALAVQSQVGNQKIQNKSQRSMVLGGSQEAAFDAGIENNKLMKGIESQRVAAFSSALGYLGKIRASWPESKEDYVKLHCGEKIEAGNFNPTNGYNKNDFNFDSNCSTFIGEIYENHSKSGIANTDAKSAINLVLAEYGGKLVKAGMQMSLYDTNAKRLNQAKQAPNEGEDVRIERCAFNPNDPACIQSGNRVASQNPINFGGYQPVSDGFSNSFGDFGNSDSFGEPGAEGSVAKQGEQASPLNNPFNNDVGSSNGIENPAAAASTQAGSAAAGGGGGGGGGAGGGSATLDSLGGGDPQTAAAAKRASSTLGYSSKGSGGYTSSATRGPASTKENPFSSLFDKKSSGGIEEGSISTSDIDRSASGLFEKISNRYNKARASKRIEARNVE